VAAKTKVGGATLTGLLGTSAWYAPGAAICQVVEAILRDEQRIIPSCVYLNGEYGQKDICIGVPVVLGKGGWQKIVNVRLSNDEKAAFEASADAVRNMNEALKSL
jgi:malate dehydrogenase